MRHHQLPGYANEVQGPDMHTLPTITRSHTNGYTRLKHTALTSVACCNYYWYIWIPILGSGWVGPLR